MARFLDRIATRMWLLAGLMAAVTLGTVITIYYVGLDYHILEYSGRLPREVSAELERLSAGGRHPRYVDMLRRNADNSLRMQDWAFLIVVAAMSTAAGGGIGLLLARRISRPITAVAAAAAQVAAGDRSVRVDAAKTSGETRELVESFNLMAADIETYERERNVLTAGIAHELRTPLTILRGRLHGLVDGLIEASPDEAERLLRQVDQLSRLVEDLRTLAHAEARQLSLDTRPLEPSDTVRMVIADLQPAAELAGATITHRLTPLELSADPVRLYQIIANLMTNAIKHSPRGGTIAVTLDRDRHDAILSITDDGPGFSADDATRLFLPFWRARASRDSGQSGSGLGLTLTARLVEAHAGTIAAANRTDRPGATFTVRLPLSGDVPTGASRRPRSDRFRMRGGLPPA